MFSRPTSNHQQTLKAVPSKYSQNPDISQPLCHHQLSRGSLPERSPCCTLLTYLLSTQWPHDLCEIHARSHLAQSLTSAWEARPDCPRPPSPQLCTTSPNVLRGSRHSSHPGLLAGAQAPLCPRTLAPAVPSAWYTLSQDFSCVCQESAQLPLSIRKTLLGHTI